MSMICPDKATVSGDHAALKHHRFADLPLLTSRRYERHIQAKVYDLAFMNLKKYQYFFFFFLLMRHNLLVLMEVC